MRLRGLWRAQRALRSVDQWRMARSSGARGLILMYHRIASDVDSPYGTTVSEANFEQHLKVIRSLFVPVSLEDCLRGIASRTLPERSVVVTFDDGYVDNLTSAAPLLEKYSVPATTFIAGDETTPLTFWWDRLQHICLGSHNLPAVLVLRLAEGEMFRWQGNGEGGLQRPAGLIPWRLGGKEPPTARHRLFQALYTLVISRPPGDQERILGEMEEWARCSPLPVYLRRMTGVEIARFAAADTISIGGHTVHHTALDFFPREMIRREVRENLRYLRGLGGRPVTFAYPYGMYDPVVVDSLRREGVIAACTSERGCVWERTNPLLLPRLHVPDEDGVAFASRLESCFT